MSEKETSFRRFYPYLTWIVVVAVGVMGLLARSLRLHPPIGVYIAVLGLFAALVSIFQPERKHEKVGAIILMTVLVCLEIHNLYRDRNQHDAEQAKILKEEHDSFKSIVESLKAEMTQNQNEFAATMQSQQKAIALADTALKNLTGYGSVPCIEPQLQLMENDVIPLLVRNVGENELTSIEVRVFDAREFAETSAHFNNPSSNVGTIHAGSAKPIPIGAHPIPGDNGIATYVGDIWTQNGYYREVMEFRRGHSQPWAVHYWLIRYVPLGKNSQGESMRACNQQFPDDLKDRKPIPK